MEDLQAKYIKLLRLKQSLHLSDKGLTELIDFVYTPEDKPTSKTLCMAKGWMREQAGLTGVCWSQREQVD